MAMYRAVVCSSHLRNLGHVDSIPAPSTRSTSVPLRHNPVTTLVLIKPTPDVGIESKWIIMVDMAYNSVKPSLVDPCSGRWETMQKHALVSVRIRPQVWALLFTCGLSLRRDQSKESGWYARLALTCGAAGSNPALRPSHLSDANAWGAQHYLGTFQVFSFALLALIPARQHNDVVLAVSTHPNGATNASWLVSLLGTSAAWLFRPSGFPKLKN